ncbi:unnamed protein product [Soboliphyme baturini]|uniref:Ig-like domain-containing protein n=1 Tax=Soboliphyme baturini TaxID=241478 RepID=A0A183IZ66_9BILA|nr:unnamed protein product [Soboliphyme baturini]
MDDSALRSKYRIQCLMADGCHEDRPPNAWLQLKVTRKSESDDAPQCRQWATEEVVRNVRVTANEMSQYQCRANSIHRLFTGANETLSDLFFNGVEDVLCPHTGGYRHSVQTPAFSIQRHLPVPEALQQPSDEQRPQLRVVPAIAFNP